LTDYDPCPSVMIPDPGGPEVMVNMVFTVEYGPLIDVRCPFDAIKPFTTQSRLPGGQPLLDDKQFLNQTICPGTVVSEGEFLVLRGPLYKSGDAESEL
jgi:hypothetical protein